MRGQNTILGVPPGAMIGLDTLGEQYDANKFQTNMNSKNPFPLAPAYIVSVSVLSSTENLLRSIQHSFHPNLIIIQAAPAGSL